MKIEVKQNEAKASPKYPYIGVSKDSGIIILFTGPDSGVCLNKGISKYIEGEYCNNWAESNFEPFNGTVILSNT